MSTYTYTWTHSGERYEISRDEQGGPELSVDGKTLRSCTLSARRLENVLSELLDLAQRWTETRVQ